MSLAQFLSQLGGAIGGQQMGNQMIPGMPAPAMNPLLGQVMPQQEQIQTPPDFMQQVAQSQEMPMQQPQMPEAPRSPTSKFTGIRDTLGQIGDYLLQANDMAPIYGPRKARDQQAQASEAVAQYLGRFDPQLADVARQSPETGMKLLTALREDTRFNRTAGQDDRRIDNQGRQIDQGDRELNERIRSNQAGENITRQGQSLQVELQNARLRDAALDRQLRMALQNDDQAHAEKVIGLQERSRANIARLEASLRGSDGATGYETISETVETPAKKTGGFLGFGGTSEPAKKTTTTRKVPVAQSGAGPSQADLEYTARKHGITVEEVKRRLSGG